MEDDTLSTGELAGRQGYTGRHGRIGEPDVLLDVPQLSVEEILLEVEELRAHVLAEASVLNLLRLSIGADVQLGRVHLDIKGVEAQALLKFRLDTIAEIINRLLSTIDRNPEIVAQIFSPLGTAASELTRTAGRSVDEVVGAVGSAVPELSRTAGRSVDEVVGAVGTAAPDLNRSVAEMIGGPDESGATAKEEVVAEATQHEAEPAGANERTPRGVRRRPKQVRNTGEAPP
jgi:hypothetical protein